MSKKVTVAGVEYDSRTIVEKTERLKLPNHPKVTAIAIPLAFNEKQLAGKMTVIVKIPFGRLDTNVKEIRLEIPSPRRIDAINKVVEAIKNCPMYRRKAA